MARRLIIAAAMLVAAGTAPVLAQIGNPAGMDPATAASAPAPSAPQDANTQDELFVLLLGMGSRAEVEAGRMAEAQANRPAVRDFARRMVSDQSRCSVSRCSSTTGSVADAKRTNCGFWPMPISHSRSCAVF